LPLLEVTQIEKRTVMHQLANKILQAATLDLLGRGQPGAL
jgi:hypothetical protein